MTADEEAAHVVSLLVDDFGVWSVRDEPVAESPGKTRIR
jgi:hypothetical protein